jgi:hypothetical protein
MLFKVEYDEPRTSNVIIEAQQQQQHPTSNIEAEAISKPPEPVKEKAKENSSGNQNINHCYGEYTLSIFWP